jgi:putative transposase
MMASPCENDGVQTNKPRRPSMKGNTKRRKLARRELMSGLVQDGLEKKILEVIVSGKFAFDSLVKDLGVMVAEAIMLMEREEQAGPDYRPNGDIYKWASQPGSIYLGGEKVKVDRPRLRDSSKGKEVTLKSYQNMKDKDTFSDELLAKIMTGMSGNRYRETLLEGAKAFGVSPSSVSEKIVLATTKKFDEFINKDLSTFSALAIYLDTIHRGGEAFIVALGVDHFGVKKALGFWQGATENSEICKELLGDIEKRGMTVSNRIIWVTDGGKGVIKALRERFNGLFIHQRCTIHKMRNILGHLAKKYHLEFKKKYKKALGHTKYGDAKSEMKNLEKWLREINESAANSLLEAINEILTLHKLKTPPSLRISLSTTNPIESMFSIVRAEEKNIKRRRGSKMQQRWLATILIYSETKFTKIKGYRKIKELNENIKTHLSMVKVSSSKRRKVA